MHQFAENIENKISEDITAQLTWKPSNQISLNKEKAIKIIEMIEVLEDHDDVQDVFANFELPEDIFNELQ